MRYTLMRYTPIKYRPMRHMPVRCKAMRCMTIKCIPMRYTPMRCTPMRCTPITGESHLRNAFLIFEQGLTGLAEYSSGVKIDWARSFCNFSLVEPNGLDLGHHPRLARAPTASGQRHPRTGAGWAPGGFLLSWQPSGIQDADDLTR